MNEHPGRVVRAHRIIAAPAAHIFALIADPTRQPEWDGNDNLAFAEPRPPITAVGEVFVMVLTRGARRDNHVVAFERDRRIAWCPAEPGATPSGHRWGFELDPIGPDRTTVTHVYDWTELTDAERFARARATTPERLVASLDRLAHLAESSI